MSLKGKKALLSRWWKILTGKNLVAVKQGAGKYYSKSQLAGYYNDLTGKVNPETLLDDEGIPINEIEGGKTVYFPISIFQYALGLWDLYIEKGDKEYRKHFLKICEWISAKQEVSGAWNCVEPIGYKKIKYSSMGQGEGVSVLLRAFKLTGESKWLDSAKAAVNFMCTDINAGGTLSLENDCVIFEEYAHLESDKKSVLNGWIFSLFGLYDYLKIVDDERVHKIYNQSLNTLAKNLKCYDRKYWSNYDMSGRIASPAYHDLHICLLTTLSDLTDNRIYLEQAEIWKVYQKSKIKKVRAIIKKAIQKLGDSTEGVLVK